MKANTNSYKHHHKSCIHPHTSLPLLAAGCFALIGSDISKAAINVNWDGGAGTAFWDDNNNWSPDANVDGASDSSGYAAFITDADTVIRDSRTIYRTNTNASAGNTASTTIGSGGSLTMDNGQRLNWNGGASVGDSTLTIENGGSLSAGFFDTNQGAGSSATFEVLSGGTATFASSFSMNDAAGTGNVIVDGSGSVITVAGNTTINGSAGNTLTISNGGTFTAGANFTYGPATLSIGGGGSRFELGSGSTDGAMTNLNAISIASGGTFVINQSDAVTQGTEFGNSISGAGSIEQAGTGTTTLNVANTHTGGTTISAGTLVIDDASALGTGAVTLSGGMLADNVAGNTSSTNDIVATASTSSAIINTSGGASDFSGTLSGSGTLNFGGTGDGQVGANVRNFGSWSGSFSGTITHESVVGGNTLFLAGLNTPSLKLSTSGSTSGAYTRFAGTSTIGELSGTGGVIRGRNGTLTVNQSTDTTYSGQLADEGTRTLTFIKDGSGSLTLDFANTYTGATTVNAGTITLTDAGRIGNGGLTVNNGGALSIANDDFNSLDGAITVNEGGTLSTDSTGNNAHNIGAITLNGGTLTSSGNTWSEGNWIFNGDVTVGGSALSTISGLAVGSKSGGGTYNVADSVAGSGTDLLVTAQMVDATGGSSLTKSGAGTMELTGANTYTGTT
ncbi:MAG: beta strand repeat-containing protein, partial [Akkermansiaceae bacterium]